jgi:CDP-paratose 2-epimerase
LIRPVTNGSGPTLDTGIPERPSAPADRDGPVLVTGGAGFVGANLADRLLSEGRDVTVLDAFVRRGVEANARWLERRHGGRVRFLRGDVRDAALVDEAVRGAAAVFHFAAQVAVTTSLDDPRDDFSVNAGGTLHVLDSVRSQPDPPPFFFTSTNKVYGCLGSLPLRARGERYVPDEPTLAARGVGETAPLDFRTPYGCSKGAADQYTLEFARSFGLPAVVFRMSCIYGPRQFGNEDQGWVAHVALCALQGRPLTIYGDGMQVRDLLFADDLVDAFLLAWRNVARLRARAFNIGGGPANVVSLLELVRLLEERGARPGSIRHDAWRSGDQKYYASDTAAFRAETGWAPRVGVGEGLDRLCRALEEQAADEPEATMAPGAHG